MTLEPEGVLQHGALRSVWVVLALLAGCNGSNQFVASKYFKSQDVIASQGGTITVTATDSTIFAGTQIIIPPGALSRDTRIGVGCGNLAGILPSTLQSAGHALDFGPDNVRFKLPVTVRIPFELPAGATADRLVVEAQESGGTAYQISNNDLTVSAGFVSFQVTSFTEFQPGLSEPPAPPDAGVCIIGGTVYASRSLNPSNRAECCNPAASTSWTPMFGDGGIYNTGHQNMTSAVVRDLDGDGLLDLAVCDNTPGVWVFLGQHDGTLSSPVFSATSFSCSAMVAGSLKGDGTNQLLFAYNDAYEIGVLVHDGGGRFGGEVAYGVPGPNPSPGAPGTYRSIILADWNGDGWPDVGYGKFGGGVGILLNQATGDGALGDAGSIDDLLDVPDIRAGDFNGDGITDFAAGARIFLGDGGGSFQSSFVVSGVPSPDSLASGRLSGGATDDLVYGTSNTQDRNVYFVGQNLGGFDTVLSDATGLYDGVVRIGDLNGDGLPDIVQASFTEIVILFNKGDGTFWPAVTLTINDNLQAVELGDLNGDKAIDIVTIPQSSGPLGVLTNGCP
jgi:hypothetical protein